MGNFYDISQISSDGDIHSYIKKMMKNFSSNMWTNILGKVVSYDSTKRTCEVQPLIKELLVNIDGSATLVELPLLRDVPVVFQSAGGFEITFPIKVDDECIVVFSKQCIDNWWKAGGVQAPFELRSFNLSDGFAIFKPYNQKVLEEIKPADEENFVIRNYDDTVNIRLSQEGELTCVGEKVTIVINMKNGNISIEGGATIDITCDTANVNTSKLCRLGGEGAKPLVTNDFVCYFSGAPHTNLVGNTTITKAK